MWVIAAIALIPRLLLVPYGLPYEFDPDERLFVDAAWHMVENGGDSNWYNVPAATLMDVLALLYWLYGLGGMLLGQFDSIAAAGDAYRADVSHFFVIARVVTAISGLGVVVVTYALLRELRVHVFWAAMAALLVAVSFALIKFSALVRPDMLMTTFLLAAVIVSMRALKSPSAKMFLVAGIFLGLAAASKYPGAVAIVPIVAANSTLVIQERITPRRGLLWLGVTALAAMVVVAIVAPYLYINFGETIRAVAGEARSTHLGATGAGFLSDFWRYLSEALPWGVGVNATIVGIIGLVAMLLFQRPRIASITFWFFLAFISFLSLWWARWALPLLPLAAIGAAFVLEQIDIRLRARRPGRWIWVPRVVVAAILIWPLVESTTAAVLPMATNDDTRLRAIEWIEENVPEGSTLLIDSYTTQLPTDRYDIVTANRGELVRWADVSDKLRPDGYFASIAGEWFGTPGELMTAMDAEGVEYLVLADVWIDLFRDEADTYPAQLATYEALLDVYPVIERFDENDASAGWALSIHNVAAATEASNLPPEE